MDFRPTLKSNAETRASRPRRAAAWRLLLGLAAGLAFLAAALSVPISLAADPDAPADEQAAPTDASGNQPQSVAAVLQGVVNGSFESGNLTGWTTGGAADRSEVLVESDFSTSAGNAARPEPTDGNFFALLCTGPGSINTTTVGNVDGDGSSTPDFDTSIITKTFTLLASEVPTTLTFDWSFLTAEGQRAPDNFDDFFEVALNGSVILAGSRPSGGVSPYADVAPMDNISYTVTGGTANETQGCNFVTGRSPFQTFRRIITNPGTYNLTFLVADQGDSNIDTGLLIDNVDLRPEIDLELTKTATPDPAVAGEPLYYELTVRNRGSGRARNVVVTDTLPLQVDFITHTLPSFITDTLPSGCTFSPGSGPDGRDQLFCDLGDMLGGVERTFRIKVDVDSNAMNTVDALTNDVVVDSLTADGNLDNNVVQLITPLVDLADLRVVKVSKPDTHVRAGEIFTYTIFVDNLGPSHARNVVLTDTILTSGDLNLVGIEEDPDRPDTCGITATPDGSLIVCELGESLEPQGDPPRNGRWVLKVRVRADEAQDIDNEVIVFSLDPDGSAGPELATPDPDTSNNRADDFISVLAVADLGMTKIGEDAGSNPDNDPFTVLAGESIIWTINIVNNGPSTAEDVRLIDTLPGGLVDGSVSVVATTPPVGGGQCTVGTPGDPTEPLICQIGNMGPGDTAVVTIVADIDPNYLINQPNTAFADFLPNDAFLVSDTLDPDTDDNIVFDALVRVLASADLGVEKLDRPDFVIAGEQLEYTLTISNTGPSSAEDVTLLDELPDALTAIEVNVVNEPHAVCSIRTTPANIIDCGLGDIQPGKTISLVVTSLVRANTLPGTITNTVSVTSLTPDPDATNNIDITQPTQVETEADVEITKVGEPVKVPAGEQVKYTITVDNNGPSDAQDVVVYDLLPDEVVYEIDTNSPMCTRPDNITGFRAVMTDTLGNDTQAVGLTTFVLITSTTGTTLTYSIEVSDIDNVTSVELTDGGITIPLYGGPPPVLDPPNPFVASIPLTNAQRDAILANPNSFVVIVRTSDFPAGEIRGTVDGAVETMTGNENMPLRCEVGLLPEGATHQFDIWALVDPATPAGSIITNVSIVTSTTSLGDPNVGNNVASFRNYVEGAADLHVRKFGKPDQEVRANEILTYTVVVDNLGPSAAEGVALKDVLQSAGSYDLVDISSDRETICVALPDSPPGVTQTFTIPATPWPPGPPPAPPLISDIQERLELDCTLTGGLEVLDADGPPNSGRWLFTMRVRGLNQSQNLNNVASVLSEQPDPNLDNNDAFVVHDIIDVADLEIDKTEMGEVQVNGAPGGTVTLQPSQVTAGQGLTYTLVIVNNGPSTTENVVLQDRLPPGIVVTGFTTTQGDCDTGTPGAPVDKLTCGLGTMAPGDTITVEVRADVDPSLPDGTILENDAFVFSDLFDDDNTNNYATDLTQVSAWADLAVTKTDNPDPVVAGELLEYTVTVTNTGPSDALNVIVQDILPEKVEFVRIRDPFNIGVICSLNAIDEQTLTCALDDIPAGEERTFVILVRVEQDAPALLTNLVSVSSDTAEPFTDNNAAEEETTVIREEGLFINKTDSPDPVLAGNELTYLVNFGNNGPSQATNVRVTDTLPLGFTFNRCESLDPNNRVTCVVDSGDGNTTPEIVRLVEIREINTPVYTDTGVIDVGDSFTFRLIADVESGYVLNGRSDAGPGEICRALFLASGYPYYAHNRIDIASTIDSAFDDECTRVEAEADLAIGKTDSAGFLQGDPLVPGDTLTYTLTVTNTGPSDAAQVYVVDWLPAIGIILDPAQVDVTVSAGQIVEIRDDGRITVIVGNDPDNNGVNQLGRLNAGNTETIQIVVRAALDAACSSSVTNFAYVETRRNDEIWPPILGAEFAPTPTDDPDPTNNTAVEETSIVCPEITIDKTVSLDGTCPGTNNVAIGFIGQPITYCYEVTNTGDTYLDYITITDTVQTRSGPFVIFEQTFRGNPEGDPGLPLAPGESFVVTNTEPDLDILIDCNDRPDTAVVTAIAVNRGRTCLLPGAGPAADGANALAPDGVAQEPACRVVRDEDDAYVQTPCKGVDWRLQLPILNTTECDTWIQVQNVGNEVTKALLVLWGAPGACPPQSFGPIKVECTGLLRPGSAWSFTNPYLPPGANSAIVYSLNATNVVEDERGNEVTFADLACLRLFPLIRGDHTEWLLFDRAYTQRGTYFGPIGDTPDEQLVLDFGANQGEPLAVTVNRTCPDPLDPNVYSSAAYVGVSTDREGIRDPRAGGFAYYAPLVWASMGGMNSILHIQNSGVECTSIELWFQQQGECLHPVVWDILAIAPGETVSFDPNIVVGPFWQGSVWVSASQPLGIIVDSLGANHFGSYHAVPADVYVDGGRGDFSLGTLVNYAPLIYREHQGWETAVQVQNLSSIYNAKVKVYFLDNSGGIIKTVVDWICPRGSQTFFLPVIAGLPGNWVGAARIESENWISPGDPAVDAPRILSVVMLEKYTDPAKTARQEAVVYNALQEMGSYDWQLGPGPRNGFGGSDVVSVPLIAQANRGVTSELAVQNLNPNPGFTDFVIFIYDQNRLIDFVCEKLNEKQVEYIDLYDWGLIPQGFLGSIVISSTYTNQPGGAALGAVAVERVGTVLGGPDVPGDESKAFEAFPLYNRYLVEKGPDGGPPQCP